MNFKQSLILMVAAFLSVALVASDKVRVEQETNLSLISFMARSNNLMQRNPTRSLECFNYYIPLINEIVEKYENDYRSCILNSENGRAEAEAATQDKRNDLADRASRSCELLSGCSEIDSAEDEFQCYVDGGSENAKTMYGINADASDQLAELKEEFRLISVREYKCTNETKREYERDSAQAYQDLNDCMLGISEVPTPAPPTDAPETEAPETEAPETEAPETEAPETEAPEDSLPEYRLLEEDLRERLISRIHKNRF